MTIEKTIQHVLSLTKDSLLNTMANELGLTARLDLKDTQLSIQLVAGFPTQTLQKSLLPQLTTALRAAIPALQVNVSLTHDIKPHRTQLVGKGLRGVKNTVAVASGKGGVGKSTVTVNLAAALARAGARVGILDADIYGPSVPLMLGHTEPLQVSGERYLPAFAHGIQAMSIGYLTHGEPALMWRGPMLAKSLMQLIDIAQWDDLDYLFIDLPPGTGDIQLSLVQKIPLTTAVVVTTPQTVATLDAEKAYKMFETTHIDVLGMIENMSLHQCSQCGHQEAIFSTGGAAHLCELYQCKLLGQLPLDARIGQDCDKGTPTAASSSNDLSDIFLKMALEVGIELSKKPLNYADRFPPIVVE